MFSNKSNISDSSFSKKKFQSEFNIALKCRGCLKEELDMNSLYVKSTELTRNTTLAKIIEESIGYVITSEEQFSGYLCKECTKILVNFMRFKTTFQKATEYFKDLRNLQSVRQNDTKEFNVKEIYNDCKDDVPIQEAKSDVTEHNNWEQYNTDNSNSFDRVTQEVTHYENCQVHEHICQIAKKNKKVNCELNDNEHFSSKLKVRLKRRTHQRNIQRKKQLLPKDTLEKPPKRSCSSRLKSNTGLQGHPVEDLISKIYCKVCKHKFLTEEFEQHFETHKTHVCITCGHKFIRKTDLNDHNETHLDICKYVCQHCGKAFKVRTALNKHKRIHTNPREEICDVCGQRFNTRDTLKTHYKLKHIKSKDFQCNLCGLAFALKSTLEKHIERHNPNRQKVYSCKLCNVSYINKYNLSRHHIIKHTSFDNKPTCEFCGKGYIKKIDLVKHVKRHHGQSTEEKERKEQGEKV